MNSLLEAISEGWSWKIGNPISIIASNAFGNAIVLNDEGQYYRIIPEEWQCEPLASSPEQLEEKRKEVDFVRDWEMRALVARAEVSEGPLAEGQVYYLVIPGFLGGKYSEENIRKISLRELLSYSGDMARQSDGLPDGAQIKIVVKE